MGENYLMTNRDNKTRMIFILIVLSTLMSFTQTLAQSKTKAVKPKNVKSKTSIIISGNSRTYYPLLGKGKSILNVKGPGTLKIILRAQFRSKAQNTVDYMVFYSINGGQKNEVDFKDVERDSRATFKEASLGFPGTGEIFVLELARGNNTIQLWSGSENLKIYARYLFTQIKEKKIEWVSLSPLYPNEPVSLVTNENVATYYRFSQKKPLKIRISGPTTLKILSRIENHFEMKGRIDYRLQVKEDGTVRNTYQLSSVRSEVTTYRKNCGRTPGKANEIIVTVPGGSHVYEIIPLDKDKDSILARIRFPKKDVKIKE